MDCLFCKTSKSVDSSLVDIKKDIKITDADGHTIIVKNVPISYCNSCNQEYYEEDVSEELDQLRSQRKKDFVVIKWGENNGE